MQKGRRDKSFVFDVAGHAYGQHECMVNPFSTPRLVRRVFTLLQSLCMHCKNCFGLFCALQPGIPEMLEDISRDNRDMGSNIWM